MNRNSIVEKIRALLSKTKENGCTEPEMMSALDKASAMMDAYDISDEEVRLTKDEAAMLHVDPPDLKDPHGIKWRLTYYVGVFCNVQIYRSRHQTGLKCIGMPSDVQFAMWLLDTLADFVFAELYGHLIGCYAPKGERRVIIRSFVEACCKRIDDRFAEFVERSKVARTSNGKELVIVKDAAIKAFMKEHHIAAAAATHRRTSMLRLRQRGDRPVIEQASAGQYLVPGRRCGLAKTDVSRRSQVQARRIMTEADLDELLTLDEACAAFLKGKGTPATLRAEHRRGNLEISKIGKRHFTTRRDLREMQRKCRVPQEARGSISINGRGLGGTDRERFRRKEKPRPSKA